MDDTLPCKRQALAWESTEVQGLLVSSLYWTCQKLDISIQFLRTLRLWHLIKLLVETNRDIIKHDRTVGPLIGQKQLKRRMRKSAVTLTALSYNHIIKTIGWLILQIDPSEKSVRYTWGLLADCTFAIEATVEAISVHETRQIFKETLYKFFPFFASMETMWRTRFPESSA